jgi:DNA polymerase III subunit epsilon
VIDLLRRRPFRRSAPRSWRSDELWVVDLETTGLDLRRDKIVSYGAVPIRDGRIHLADAVYGLVGINEPVPPASARIHGIRTQDLQSAPSLRHAVAELDSVIGTNPIVAHCAVIERTLLRRAYHRCYRTLLNEFIDTAVLAAAALDLHLDGAAVSLEYAAHALGVPVHNPHHALGDAVTTANLLLALAARLERELADTPLTTAALVDLSTANERH